MNFEKLREELRVFAEERDWVKFHRPKNLAMALAGEVGELVSELRWYVEDEIQREVLDVPERRERLENEVADVLIFLVRFADVCGLDLLDAAHRKTEANRLRYPIDVAHGSPLSHRELAVRHEEGER